MCSSVEGAWITSPPASRLRHMLVDSGKAISSRCCAHKQRRLNVPRTVVAECFRTVCEYLRSWSCSHCRMQPRVILTGSRSPHIQKSFLSVRLEFCRCVHADATHGQPHALFIIHVHSRIVAFQKRGIGALGANVVEELLSRVGACGGGRARQCLPDTLLNGRQRCTRSRRKLTEKTAVQCTETSWIGSHSRRTNTGVALREVEGEVKR